VTQHLRGHPAHHGPVRDVAVDHRVGTHGDVVTDHDRSEKLGAGGDVDPVTDHRRAPARAAPGDADRDVLRQGGVAAHDDLAVQDDPTEVADVQPGADRGLG